jgi:4-aminobutyrate--pyruvate transaminase
VVHELGYSDLELVEAARAQLMKQSFTHLFAGRSHDPAIELAEKLKDIVPVEISKVFFCSSGSCERHPNQLTGITIMRVPKKKKIISRLKAYLSWCHLASASLTGRPNNHIDFDLPIANILHASCPHHYRFAHAGESETDFARGSLANLRR